MSTFLIEPNGIPRRRSGMADLAQVARWTGMLGEDVFGEVIPTALMSTLDRPHQNYLNIFAGLKTVLAQRPPALEIPCRKTQGQYLLGLVF